MFIISDPGTAAFKNSYEDIKQGVTPFISFEFGDEDAAEDIDGTVHIKNAELRAISLNVPDPAYEDAESHARDQQKKRDNETKENKEMTEEQVKAMIADVIKAERAAAEEAIRAKKRAATEEDVRKITDMIKEVLGEDYQSADTAELVEAFKAIANEMVASRAEAEEEKIEAKEEEEKIERCEAIASHRRNRFLTLGLRIFDPKAVETMRRSFNNDSQIKLLRDLHAESLKSKQPVFGGSLEV